MEADNLLVLSPICRHTTNISLMYELTHPWRGRGVTTVAGRAGAKGVTLGRMSGTTIDDGLGVGSCADVEVQWVFLVNLLATSVISLMITHHLAEIKEPPKLSLR